MNKTAISIIIKVLLLVIALFWLIFSLMSGFESSGGFNNLPNALPWLVLLIGVIIAFRWEIVGSVLIIMYAIFAMIFFGFGIVVFIISLPLAVLAGALLLFRIILKYLYN
jgi:hypothetical protein